MIGIGIFSGNQACIAMTGGGEAVLPPAEATSFYPDVAAVSLSETAGAIAFPEYNGRVGYTDGVANQTVNNPRCIGVQPMNFAFPAAANSDVQVIVVASLPMDKRNNLPTVTGLFGCSTLASDGNTATSANQFSIGVTSAGRLQVKQPSVSTKIATPLNSVPERFIASFKNIASPREQSILLIEIGTGTQVAGETTTATSYASWSPSNMNIGNVGAVYTEDALATTAARAAWPGIIEAVYFLVGATISDAVIAQIARGEVLAQDVLPVANVRLARVGGAGGFVKPAWATSDTSDATVMLGSGARPAASLLPQSVVDYVHPRLLSDGRVHALLPGSTQRQVPFECEASGPVEVQVYNAADGVVVRDWTTLAGYDAGAKIASGSFLLPRGEEGWYRARIRLVAHPEIVAHGPRFGVGYRIKVLGQSQVAYGLGGSNPGLFVLNPDACVSVAGGGQVNELRLDLVGGNARSDSYVTFANTWAVLAGRIPVMLVHSAIVGSGMNELLYDDDSVVINTYGRPRYRGWSGFAAPNEQPLLDTYGYDYTAIAWSWFTSDSGSALTWRARMKALLTGDDSDMPTPASHSFGRSLIPGWARIYMPALRGGWPNSPWGEGGTVMAPWAANNGNVFALPSLDMISRYQESGHTSGEHARGAARFGRSLAFGLARATGDTDIGNPCWTNARRTAENVIMVDFVPAAGGTLSIPNNTDAIHSWGWSLTGTEGSWNWNDGTVTQSISGNSIVLTKTDGDWPANVCIAYHSQACPNTGASLPSGYTATDWWVHQERVMNGICYETWADDPLGLGLPIVGSHSDGKWMPVFQQAVA